MHDHTHTPTHTHTHTCTYVATPQGYCDIATPGGRPVGNLLAVRVAAALCVSHAASFAEVQVAQPSGHGAHTRSCASVHGDTV